MDMDSKVALVTGAGRGIGLATARRFLAEGWRVALPAPARPASRSRSPCNAACACTTTASR